MNVLWFVLCLVLVVAVILLVRRLRRSGDHRRRLDLRLAGVLEGLDAGLSVWDQAGRLVGANRRFKEFYPDVPLEPGVIYEDLIRYTANRGLVNVSTDDIDSWVCERVERFGKPSHEVLRTADRRWIDVHSRTTHTGEVLVLFTDTTGTRAATETLSDQSGRLQQQALDVELINDVVAAVSEADTPELLAGHVLELVCDRTGWSVGSAYSVRMDDGRPVLESVLAWYATEAESEPVYDALRQATEGTTEQSAEGLAGRALQTRRIVWIPNVSVDPSVDDARRMLMPGILGACVVPVVRHDVVLLIFEFFSREQLTPNPNLTRVLETVSRVVGLWLRPSV